ncbi:MAG: hypothetical protein KC731_13475 [Myxococcales bacterium]|nr:hypothetical protein [Myxococcales bacterium]
MLVECPHCLSEVLPQPDRTCPSCRGAIDEEGAGYWSKLRVSATERLPAMCCTCGEPTDEVEKVGADSRDGAPGWARLLALVFKPSLLFRPELKATQTLFEIAMPRCADCRSDEALVPEHVNEAHRAMTFVVARSFKERVEALRPT